MKNFVLVLMALLAVPAFAAPIITATETDGVVTIGYDANGTDLVSGMGIVVTLSDGTIKTGTFQDLSTDYWVHPTNIVIDNNSVSDEGSPIYAGGEGQATITVEYGALYDGEANAPAEFGPLFSFEIQDATGDVTVTAVTSHAGGLVTEALASYDALTAEVTVAGAPAECMKTTAPEYADWVALGRPDCWCFERQCRGDIDGLIAGPFWVGFTDLNLLKAAFNKLDTALPEGGICADLDHAKSGPFRVGFTDLNILKQYFNKIATMVPACDSTNYNFWTN